MGANIETSDLIDRMNAAWRRERPDLDPSALEVVGRVIVIARYLERSVGESLEPLGLTLGQFDILATLRREGSLTPTRLMRSVMLSSGGMTARLDRLEEAGLIERHSGEEDRREVVVALTDRGRAAIDAATEARFEEARASLPPLSAKENDQLAALLRRWLVALAPPTD